MKSLATGVNRDLQYAQTTTPCCWRSSELPQRLHSTIFIGPVLAALEGLQPKCLGSGGVVFILADKPRIESTL